jgi:hypothetical protein
VARRHRESLERFPFDSVLFPYNFTQLHGDAYARDAEVLIALCEQRGVAIQTIKAITRAPWQGERPARPTTWYEPLTDQGDIDLGVRFVLGRPGLFLNTASDIDLLAKILDAADRGGPSPTAEEMDDLVRREKMAPLFA